MYCRIREYIAVMEDGDVVEEIRDHYANITLNIFSFSHEFFLCFIVYYNRVVSNPVCKMKK